jgi:hypothetical protein
MAPLNFQCAFTATSLRIMEHKLKQHNTAPWDPGFIPRILQTQAECSHSLPGPQVLNNHLKTLSNSGFFY